MGVVKHIDDIITDDTLFNRPISWDKTNNYSKRYQSTDKKKDKNANNRLARYQGFLIYRKMKLPEGESHINYISYCKIVLMLFQHLLYEIVYNRLSWEIKGFGKIYFLSTKKTKQYSPRDKEFKYGDFIRVEARIKHVRNASHYVKRFKFKLADSIAAFYKKDHSLSKTSIIHQNFKTLQTI